MNKPQTNENVNGDHTGAISATERGAGTVSDELGVSCEQVKESEEFVDQVKVKILDDEDFLLYVNGTKKQIAVKNPEIDQGKLIGFDALEPFNEQEKGRAATIEDAQALKRGWYTEFFKKPFKNLIILSGAGSSVDLGLPLMTGLWKFVETELTSPVFETLCSTIKHTKRGDFEALISRIDGFIEYSDDIEIEGKKLSDYRETILNVIRKHTNVGEPTGKFPHAVFLQKLLQRKQTSSRVKVFTLNYDLLFEKAANKINAVVIDGFSFTSPRTFSGRYFDYDIVQREGSKVSEEDNFVTRVFHLYKLHGSLNWQKDPVSDSIIIADDATNPLMVYPREGKYKDSYEQPFFEMIARFQRNLRQENDTLLLCVGYSFNDNHINAAIEEAINQNPGFRIAVIDPYFSRTTSDAYKRLIGEALETDRIMIVSETFSDFADYFPEIQTYDNELRFTPINLRNAGR